MWAERIRGWTAAGHDVFAYFDNDVKVRAPFDAIQLLTRLSRRFTRMTMRTRRQLTPGRAPAAGRTNLPLSDKLHRAHDRAQQGAMAKAAIEQRLGENIAQILTPGDGAGSWGHVGCRPRRRVRRIPRIRNRSYHARNGDCASSDARRLRAVTKLERAPHQSGGESARPRGPDRAQLGRSGPPTRRARCVAWRGRYRRVRPPTAARHPAQDLARRASRYALALLDD